MRALLLATASLALCAPAVSAQDYSQEATAGSISLTEGFSPDPYTVQITSGGTREARNLSSSCRGWIANAPDFSVYYDGSYTFPLSFGVDSDSDTTLVINDPNTDWYCDDDGGQGVNPLVTISNPPAGRYDVWVGSYSQGEYASSTLSISEIGSVANHQGGGSYNGGGGYSGGGSYPDVSLNALYATISLSAGFQPDPYLINVTSGGSIEASNVRSDCRGWIAEAPDVQLSWSAGSLPLIISADSSSDTTLVINDPNGNWHCNDDGGQGVNPSLTFNNLSGVYDIWIGSYSQGGGASAELNISEVYSE